MPASGLNYLNRWLQWPPQVTGKELRWIAALLWALDTCLGWVPCSLALPHSNGGGRWRELPARAKLSFLSPFHLTSGGSVVVFFPEATCHVARAMPEFPSGGDVGVHCTVGMGKISALQTHIKICSFVLGSHHHHTQASPCKGIV